MSIIGIIIIGLLIYRQLSQNKINKWQEKLDKAIHTVAVSVNCDWDTSKYIVQVLGRYAVPIDIIINGSEVIDLGEEKLYKYKFTYSVNKGYFILDENYSIRELVYNDINLLQLNAVK